jgi:hypothetical protein
MLRQKLLPTFQGIATGKAATLELPLGFRYHVIWLELGDSAGTTLASGNLIGDIRVKVNGKVQRVHTGVELDAINSVNGAAYGAKTSGTPGTAGYRTYLPIYFCEPWRKNQNEVALVAWNAAGIASLQIEVDVKSGLTSPVLQGYYEYDGVTGTLGGITKWIRQSFGAVGTKQDFSTIDRRDFLQAIHLFPTSDGKFVQQLKLTANGNELRDLITTLQNQTALEARELLPDISATPRFDLVLDYDDPINGALRLDGLQEFTLHVEYDSAANGTMTAMIIRTGPPE